MGVCHFLKHMMVVGVERSRDAAAPPPASFQMRNKLTLAAFLIFEFLPQVTCRCVRPPPLAAAAQNPC